jgi:GNAT superfamily N-acetyltransferase
MNVLEGRRFSGIKESHLYLSLPLASHQVAETAQFLTQQFTSIHEWCRVEEIAPRLQERHGIGSELLGRFVQNESTRVSHWSLHDSRVIAAGIACRYPLSPLKWFIPVVAVDEEYRNQGVGYGLMRSLIKDVKAHGGAEIYTDTNVNRPRSLKFLEACGFAVYGHVENYDGVPGDVGVLLKQSLNIPKVLRPIAEAITYPGHGFQTLWLQ